MELKIKNKELEKIDGALFSFNKEYGMALDSLGKIPNLYAKEELVHKADLLKKKLKLIKTNNEFEKLLIENNLRNLEIQKSYLIYFTTADKGTLDELFSKVLGKNALKIIKDKSKSFDYKKYWEYFLAYQEYTYKQLPSDDESLQGEFKKILEELKKDLLDYAEIHFEFPKDYEFDLLLGQPYSQQTYFHPTTKRMEISPQNFFVFKEDGLVKINVCKVIDVLFHELLGHGRHELNSRNLPLTLQSNAINNANIVSGIHKEGIAQINREYAINFMQEYKKKYKIEEDYIEQIKLSSIGDTADNLYVLYHYLKLKSNEDKSVDIEKEFKKITKNYGLFILLSSAENINIGCIIRAKYPIGYEYMKEILEKLKKEIGEKKFKENHAIINKAISVGAWHFEILPKFLRLFLKGSGVL